MPTHTRKRYEKEMHFTRNYIHDFVEGFNDYLLVEFENDTGRAKERKNMYQTLVERVKALVGRIWVCMNVILKTGLCGILNGLNWLRILSAYLII
jgi:hypothetical protein